jgi:ankyrin repeat protein
MDIFDLVESNDYIQLKIGGFDIGVQNMYEQTPAHIACKYGRIDCLRVLLDAGADINSGDYLGWTCLITACAYFEMECVEELLQRGADTSIVDRDGGTALHNLCVDLECENKFAYLDYLRIYLRNCSDLEHRNRDGKTARVLAEERGWSDIIGVFDEFDSWVKGASDD